MLTLIYVSSNRNHPLIEAKPRETQKKLHLDATSIWNKNDNHTLGFIRVLFSSVLVTYMQLKRV